MPSDADDAATTAMEDSPGDPASVFALLSDETRVAILRELAAADEPVAFAALCARVGIEDSGRFNYHLGKLRGLLVEKHDAGYVLTDAGARLAATASVVAPIER